MTTRILIGDGSTLVVVGAQTVLQQRADTVLLRAENGDELVMRAKEVQPDIILLGERFDPLRDTLLLVERIMPLAPAARIIVIGTTTDGLVIRDLFTMGICGYLTLGDDLTVCLLTAVETVLRERPYLSPTANAEYLITMHGRNRNWQMDSEARSVLRLVASGYTPTEIATHMDLKLRRVYWVIEKMRARFGASTNAHLINRAVAEGFIGLPD